MLQQALELGAGKGEAVVDGVGEAVQRAHRRLLLRGVPRRTCIPHTLSLSYREAVQRAFSSRK